MEAGNPCSPITKPLSSIHRLERGRWGGWVTKTLPGFSHCRRHNNELGKVSQGIWSDPCPRLQNDPCPRTKGLPVALLKPRAGGRGGGKSDGGEAGPGGITVARLPNPSPAPGPCRGGSAAAERRWEGRGDAVGADRGAARRKGQCGQRDGHMFRRQPMSSPPGCGKLIWSRPPPPRPPSQPGLRFYKRTARIQPVGGK